MNKNSQTIEVQVDTAVKNVGKEFSLYSEEVCEENTNTKGVRTRSAAASTTASTSYRSTSHQSGGYYSSGYGGTSYGYGYGGGYNSLYERRHTVGSPLSCDGTVGLTNLGNTCFMASMLQCLSNTKEFSDFFLSDEYKASLNRESIHSHKGKIADEYAALIKDMWGGVLYITQRTLNHYIFSPLVDVIAHHSHHSVHPYGLLGRYSACAPVDFKRTIGEFAPQFAGYQQQDSQEFLLFFLDGLHEDLNRIKVIFFNPSVCHCLYHCIYHLTQYFYRKSHMWKEKIAIIDLTKK